MPRLKAAFNELNGFYNIQRAWATPRGPQSRRIPAEVADTIFTILVEELQVVEGATLLGGKPRMWRNDFIHHHVISEGVCEEYRIPSPLFRHDGKFLNGPRGWSVSIWRDKESLEALEALNRAHKRLMLLYLEYMDNGSMLNRIEREIGTVRLEGVFPTTICLGPAEYDAMCKEYQERMGKSYQGGTIFGFDVTRMDEPRMDEPGVVIAP